MLIRCRLIRFCVILIRFHIVLGESAAILRNILMNFSRFKFGASSGAITTLGEFCLIRIGTVKLIRSLRFVGNYEFIRNVTYICTIKGIRQCNFVVSHFFRSVVFHHRRGFAAFHDNSVLFQDIIQSIAINITAKIIDRDCPDNLSCLFIILSALRNPGMAEGKICLIPAVVLVISCIDRILNVIATV